MDSSIEGLWIIKYEGVPGDGRGIVVLTSGRFVGGESAWYYDGAYETRRGEFSAKITLTHYGKPTSKSTAGHLPEQSPVRLDIVGQRVDADTIDAEATPHGGGEPAPFRLHRVVCLGMNVV